MRDLEIQVQTLPHFEGLSLPQYQTHGSSGLDLVAALQDPVLLKPGRRALIPTGLCVCLPEGLEAQIRPRSGLAIRHGVTLLNSPGTIDSDYRGEIQIIMINLGQEDFTIERGMRIAQMILSQVVKARLVVVDNLDVTHRAGGGFGHTGV